MRKFSKLLTMALVILAVITMSLTVKAETKDLSAYLNESHEVNGMVFELTEVEKTALTTYIDQYIDNATADDILKDMASIEKLIKNTGKSSMKEIDPAVITSAVDIAKRACQKAGLTLAANTADKTFKITKNSDGTSVITGTYANKITESKTSNVAKKEDVKKDTTTNTIKTENKVDTKKDTNTTNTTNTTSSDKLLYTGYNPVVYVVAMLAIVAIAVVAKRRV